MRVAINELEEGLEEYDEIHEYREAKLTIENFGD